MKDHYVVCEAVTGPFEAYSGEQLIAEAQKVIKLSEFSDQYKFDPVYYFPPAAIKEGLLSISDLVTSCPIKGTANYFHLDDSENAIWQYPYPVHNCQEIKLHMAFDLSKGIELFNNGSRVERQGWIPA